MDGWFKSVAEVNPLSHMIEGARSLVIRGWDLTELATGLTIASGIFVLGILISARALRARLADKA